MANGFNLNANINIQNVNTRQAQNALNQVGKAAKENTRLVDKFADALDLKTRSFVAYAIVSSAVIKLSNVIANATRDAVRFESELAKIAQTSDISVKSTKSLTKELLEVSKAYGVSVVKITETIRVLNQAGISFRDATEAAKALAKTTLLSSFEDYSVTLDGTIAAMKQFEIEGRNVEKFLSSINQVSKRYAVESTDLLETIKRTGGVFKTTGGSVEELLALFTSVRGTTRESADTIATGLRTIFSRLQRPKTVEYFKELGIQLANSKGEFIGNFKAIQEISRGLDRLGIKAGSIRFAEVVEEIGGIRQSSRVIPLLTQTTAQLEALEIAKKSNLSLDEDIAKQQKTLEFRLEQLSKEFTALIVNMSQNEGFQFIASLMIETARAAVRLTEALAPLAPLIAAIGAFQFGTIVKRFAIGPKSPFKFSLGGKAPGSGFKDTVPAMLTPGEFVIRKQAAQKIGYNNLQEMNMYADGGLVGNELGSPKDRPTDVIRTKTQANAIMQDLIESLGEAGDALKEIPVIIQELETPIPGKVRKGVYSPSEGNIKLNPNYATPSTLYHESGHALDRSLGGGKGYASEQKGTFQNALVESQKKRIEAELRAAGETEEFIQYATKNKEIFARMFAAADAELQKILVSTTDVKEGAKLIKERSAKKNAVGDIKGESLKDKLSDKQIDDIIMSGVKEPQRSSKPSGSSRLAELEAKKAELLSKGSATRSDIAKKLANIEKEILREKELEKAGVKSVRASVEEAKVSAKKSKEAEFVSPAGPYGPNQQNTNRGLIRYQAPTSNTQETGIIKYEGQQAGIIPTGVKKRNNQIANYKFNTSRPINNSQRLGIGGPTGLKTNRELSTIRSGGELINRSGGQLIKEGSEKQVTEECIPVRICNPEDIKCGGGSTSQTKDKNPKDDAQNAQVEATQKNTLGLLEVLSGLSILSFGINSFAQTFEFASEEWKKTIENFTGEMIKNTTSIGIGASIGGNIGNKIGGLGGSISSFINKPKVSAGGKFSGYGSSLQNFNNGRTGNSYFSASTSQNRRNSFQNAAVGVLNRDRNTELNTRDFVQNFALATGTLLTVGKTLLDTKERTRLQETTKQTDKLTESGDVAGAVASAKKQAELQERTSKDAIAGPLLAGIGGAIGTALSPILGPLGPELGAALGNFLSQFEIVQDITVAAIDQLISVANVALSFFGGDPFPTLTESFEKAKETAILEARSRALFNKSVKTFERATDEFKSRIRLADAVGGREGARLRGEASTKALGNVKDLLGQRVQIKGGPEEIVKEFDDKFNEALSFASDAITEEAKGFVGSGQTVEQALGRLGANFDQNNSILQNSNGVIGDYIASLREAGKTNQEIDSSLANLSASIIEVSKETDGLAEATKNMTSIQEALAEASMERIRIEFERRDNQSNRDLSLSEVRGRASTVGSTQGLLKSISEIGQLRTNAAGQLAANPEDQKLKAQLEIYESQFKIITEQSKEYISIKEQEINVVKKSAEQFYNFLDTMTYGTNQEKRNLDASIKLAKTAASQGIGAIAPNKRGEVQQALEQFADLPIFNGKTGAEVKGDFAVQEATRLNGKPLTKEQERQVRNRSSSPQERIANEIADLKTALVENEENKLKTEYEALFKHDEAFGAAVNLFVKSTTDFAAAIATQKAEAAQRDINRTTAEIAGLEDQKAGVGRIDREEAQAKLDAMIAQGESNPKAASALLDKIGLSPNQKKFFEGKLNPTQPSEAAQFFGKNIAPVLGSLLGGGFLGQQTTQSIQKGTTAKQLSPEEYKKIIDEAKKLSDDPLRGFVERPGTQDIDAKINSLKEKRQKLIDANPNAAQNLSVDASFGTVPVNVNISAPDMGVLADMMMEKTLAAISNKFGQMAENQAFGVS